MEISVWNVLGFAFLGLSAYMIITRVVIPRFGNPWVNKRRREEAIGKAEELLDRSDLDEETRYRIQRCLTTLRAHGSQQENWGGRAPISDVVEEINAVWEERRASQT
ncbi:hypothetical protein BH23CHL2_BH23CHL2_23170 [soil metagenome]